MSVDLVVTSPPYDNLRSYSGSNDWSFEVFKVVASQLYSVLKIGGVIVWVVNDSTISGSETGTSFRQALYFKELGLNIHDTMIWRKDSCPFPDKIRYYSSFEYMFVFSKGRPKSFNPIKDRVNKWAGLSRVHREYDRRKDDEYLKRVGKEYTIGELGVRYNVWDIPIGCGKNTSDKDLVHPAIFPESLARDHVISWSNPGDLVLDPFMGSGTVGKVCALLERDFIGIERVEKYFTQAESRISKYLNIPLEEALLAL